MPPRPARHVRRTLRLRTGATCRWCRRTAESSLFPGYSRLPRLSDMRGRRILPAWPKTSNAADHRASRAAHSFRAQSCIPKRGQRDIRRCTGVWFDEPPSWPLLRFRARAADDLGPALGVAADEGGEFTRRHRARLDPQGGQPAEAFGLGKRLSRVL